MATKETITKGLRELQHLPNCPITASNVEQIVDQFHYDLEDIPDEIMDAAVVYYRTGSNQFFPSSGQLREKATELLLISMDVPTAHQAWAQVLNAVRQFERVWCKEGEVIYNKAYEYNGISTEYVHAWWKHEDECKECKRGGPMEVYDHPIVEQIVREMGGRETLLNGDPSVCRSLFLRGYNELVTHKTKLATMAAPVKETVKSLQAQNSMAALAEGMKR